MRCLVAADGLRVLRLSDGGRGQIAVTTAALGNRLQLGQAAGNAWLVPLPGTSVAATLRWLGSNALSDYELPAGNCFVPLDLRRVEFSAAETVFTYRAMTADGALPIEPDLIRQFDLLEQFLHARHIAGGAAPGRRDKTVHSELHVKMGGRKCCRAPWE